MSDIQAEAVQDTGADTPQRVLIIDDEPDIRELLILTLSRMGLDVTAAEDLRQARRALDQHTFREEY